jgi:hypothetical protein
MYLLDKFADLFVGQIMDGMHAHRYTVADQSGDGIPQAGQMRVYHVRLQVQHQGAQFDEHPWIKAWAFVEVVDGNTGIIEETGQLGTV